MICAVALWSLVVAKPHEDIPLGLCYADEVQCLVAANAIKAFEDKEMISPLTIECHRKK